MNSYTKLKKDIRDDLINNIIEDFSDLIYIQGECMSWYRNAYVAEEHDFITNDEAIIIACTMKTLVKSISYSLYHNEMISINDLLNLFNEKIEFYESC